MFLIRPLPAKRSSLNTVQCDVPQDVSFLYINISRKPRRGYTLLNVGHEYFPLALTQRYCDLLQKLVALSSG